MKAFYRLTGLLLAALFIAGPALASERQGTLEFFTGQYSIREPLFKTVYQEGSSIQGLILSSTLLFNIDFYLELKAINKKGELTYSKEPTTLVLIPVSLGLRYVLPLGFVQPYAGAGIDFYLFFENNPIGSYFNYVRGYHGLGGVYIRFAKKFPILLNFKAKYTKADYYWPPQDLIVLSGLLDGSFRVSVLDAIINAIDARGCLERILDGGFQAVIFTTGTATLKSDLALASAVKAARPGM